MIHARIEGKSELLLFQGRAYKDWGRTLLASHRAAPDASEFRGATVETHGTRLVIRAKRYSLAHCFWDLRYAVVLEKEGGSYRIVDERLTTQPDGVCASVVASLKQEPIAPAFEGSVPTRPPTELPAWHPLSQDELTEAALKLARETAARTQDLVPPDVPSNPGPIARGEVSPASTLWVNPPE
jgi:hypothetical protein